jgi:carotenoid cleavage dioxygenase-like enzyme
MPRQGNHFDLSCYWYHPSNMYKKVNSVLYLSSMMYNQLPFHKNNNGNKVNSWVLKRYRENISNLSIHLRVNSNTSELPHNRGHVDSPPI